MDPNTQALKPQAKHFFLQLGIIALLYTAVTSFITFSFEVINYLFPDRQAYAFDPYNTGLRLSVSILIVVFPVLVYLSRRVYKELETQPDQRGNVFRRWLSYLTIFLSGAALIVDLIVLINVFLNGEVSSRFFSKFTIVLLVAFAVFWYTIRELKGVYFERPKLLRLFTTIVSVVVLVCIIGGFFIMGSPATQRKLRDDRDRVSDLNSIQYKVLEHCQRFGALPVDLDATKDDFNSYWDEDMFLDPATEQRYEYSVLTGTTSITFELCASFELATNENLEGRGAYGYGGYDMDYSISKPIGNDFDQGFKHIEGRNCFTRTIDPVRYPVYEKN